MTPLIATADWADLASRTTNHDPVPAGGRRREVDVRLGRVPEELAGTSLAVTFAPVSGFARHSASVAIAYPRPWLARPTDQRLTSYSAWRKGVRR